MVEGAWEFAQPVHMCVDLVKVYYGVLQEVLREYRVDGPLYSHSESLFHLSGNVRPVPSMGWTLLW